MNGPELPESVRRLLERHEWVAAQEVQLLDPTWLLKRIRLFLRYQRDEEAARDLQFLQAHWPDLPAAAIEWDLLELRRYASPSATFDGLSHTLNMPGLDARARARGLLARALAQHRLEAWQSALRSIEEGLTLCDAEGDVETRIDLLQAAATVHTWRGQHSHALLRLTLALADCALTGDRVVMAQLLGECGRVNLEIRRYSHALELFLRQKQLSDGWIDRHGRVRLDLALAQSLIGLSRYDEAMILAEGAERAANAEKLTYLLVIARRDKALILLRTGQLKLAEAEIAGAQSMLPPASSAFERHAIAAVQAELSAVIDASDAAEQLQTMVGIFRAAGLAALEIEMSLLLAEVLARRSRGLAAFSALGVALGRARENHLTLLETRVREMVARLDLADELREESGRPIVESSGGPHDGYVLLEKLGSGRLGAVYRAFDIEAGREIALKRLLPEQGSAAPDRRSLYESVRTEFQMAARVREPGIARVLAFGSDQQGDVYCIQDYVPGPTLRQQMDSDCRKAGDLVTLMKRLAHSLAALHSAGVVHGDLSPSNIICPSPSQAVIVDLGLAFRAGERPFAGRGTDGYAAPELRSGRSADGRADLYSLGAIGFEWLTGHRPSAPSHRKLIFGPRLTAADASRIACSHAPKTLIRLVTELLAANPAHRPSTAIEVEERLEKDCR